MDRCELRELRIDLDQLKQREAVLASRIENFDNVVAEAQRNLERETAKFLAAKQQMEKAAAQLRELDSVKRAALPQELAQVRAEMKRLKVAINNPLIQKIAKLRAQLEEASA